MCSNEMDLEKKLSIFVNVLESFFQKIGKLPTITINERGVKINLITVTYCADRGTK